MKDESRDNEGRGAQLLGWNRNMSDCMQAIIGRCKHTFYSNVSAKRGNNCRVGLLQRLGIKWCTARKIGFAAGWKLRGQFA